MTIGTFVVSMTADDFVLCRLAFLGRGRRSVNQFAADVKNYISKDTVWQSVARLSRSGLVRTEPKLSLTDAGSKEAQSRFGDIRGGDKRLTRIVLPALALGLLPNSDAAKRLSRAENLRALVLTKLFSLPVPIETVTLSQAIAAIVVRAAKGFAPSADKTSLIAGEHELGDLSDIDRLRTVLVKLALNCRVEPSATIADQPISERDADAGDAKEFSIRIRHIAAEVTTPPFTHKASIAQIYDAYGRKHRDAGALEEFKQRLYRAYVLQELVLLPLDDPKALDPQLRDRSEIKTPTMPLHFVDRREA
jgi:hypothetical protein